MLLSNGERLLAWPLSQHIITEGWTYNDGSRHNAIGLRASVGKAVYAAESGTVNWVQNWDGHTKTGNQSYGNLVRVRHADYNGEWLETYYAHLSRICVSNGEKVTEGQIIGYSGESGNCYGAHLHFEVRLGGMRVNPLNWLDSDFHCATTEVSKHLGVYNSVSVPVSTEKKQVITVKDITRGDYEAICESLVIMGKTYKVTFTIETEPLTQEEADKIYLKCSSLDLLNGNYSSRWEVS